MIKAPFNFVPLNDEAYLVEWADRISQDIPFEDGISGTLRLRIEAKTPIFVNDHEPKDEKNKNDVREFCHILLPDNRKQYFIPGTSVKGMVKNVMEILSFGKMTQVQNQSFGIRDLTNGDDGQFYRKKVNVVNVCCGWMWQENGHYFLSDCGTPRRISAQRLDELFPKMDFVKFITNQDNFKSDKNKTAKKKYDLLHDAGFGEEDLEIAYVPDDTSITAGGRKFVRKGQGNEYGTIVFTGQPGPRRQAFNQKKKKYVWSGKFFEFVFPDKIEKDKIPVYLSVFNAFESVHQESSDYTDFRKAELRKGKRIPIFFTKDKDENIDSIGLSYMYKYPAYNSVLSGIPEKLRDLAGHDLCECIFGYTGKTNSLKGRVSFSGALLQGAANLVPDTRLALAKPHPSFYPLYLGQGQTWNTKDIRLAGRKRYPVREEVFTNQGTEGMSRVIRPLDRGSVFEGVVHFHNLRPVELGALLSAIDFCGHAECCHNIGQGKPLGYGRVSVSVIESELHPVSVDCTLDEARNAFTVEMENKFPGWGSCPQLKELFKMAEGIPQDRDQEFRYMQMSTTGANEFKDARKAYGEGEQLGSFTQILDRTVPTIKLKLNVSADLQRRDVEKAMQEVEAASIAAAEQARERAEEEQMRRQKEEEQMRRRNEANAIYLQANAAQQQRQYSDAIKLFRQASEYGFETYDAQIYLCEKELEKERILASDITSFLNGIRLASINAFANQLGKRYQQTSIMPDDIPAIVSKLQGDWKNLDKKQKKDWTDWKKWGAMEKAIGTESANAVYNEIRNFNE